MSTLFDEISKEVGYSKRKVEYPSIAEVRQALTRKGRHDIFNLVMWDRNLGFDGEVRLTSKQEKILHMVREGLATMTV